ncbi:hypothetical protein HY025_02995 [Candidatus Daviesbacteria bacterium]|nr:hypothetical protein [Candidatus Daviesbacteria bacterium]
MNRLKVLTVSFLTLGVLSFPALTFAGGGPMSLYAFPLRPFDQTKTFILQADITTTEPCDQIKPVFKFKDSVDGDSITPFTPPSDGTYFTRHYNTGQPDFIWREVCTTYVQAKSAAAKQRTAVVAAIVNGSEVDRETLVSFGDDPFSKQLQNFGRTNDYNNTPSVDVISEKYLGGVKREVNLQWQKISWATKYAVFAREIIDGSAMVEPTTPLTTTSETKATINLAAFSDFYISVVACKTDDPCSFKKDSMYESFLSRIRNVQQASNPVKVSTSISQIQPVIAQASPNQDSKKLDELNKKVSDLENQLNESKKRQSFLEEKVNYLTSWIKSIFPFFK